MGAVTDAAAAGSEGVDVGEGAESRMEGLG